MLKFLRGKKTYVIGSAWIIWAAWLFIVENEQAEAGRRLMEGLALITLRAGVTKVAK